MSGHVPPFDFVFGMTSVIARESKVGIGNGQRETVGGGGRPGERGVVSPVQSDEEEEEFLDHGAYSSFSAGSWAPRRPTSQPTVPAAARTSPASNAS